MEHEEFLFFINKSMSADKPRGGKFTQLHINGWLGKQNSERDVIRSQRQCISNCQQWRVHCVMSGPRQSEPLGTAAAPPATAERRPSNTAASGQPIGSAPDATRHSWWTRVRRRREPSERLRRSGGSPTTRAAATNRSTWLSVRADDR